MTVEDLYQEYLKLRDRYQSLISPDPDMLKATPEAERLFVRLSRAWTEYYFTKYPYSPPEDEEK